MKTRPLWLLAVLVVGFVHWAEAQQPKKMPVIGILESGSRDSSSERVEAFRQVLREFGYIERETIGIEYRYAEGSTDRFAALAAELAQLKVDVIVTASTPGARAAKNATRAIAIVFASINDPVTSGLVASLARPGGNITGITNLSPDLGGKRLELLREAFPKITRVAHLWNPDSPAFEMGMQSAVQALGLQLQSLEIRSKRDFDRVFAAALREKTQALIISPNPLINTHHKRIVDFTAKNQLPAIYSNPVFVHAGGLMSYAPDINANFRRAAIFVDKILKETKPAELPVEQPTKFELVINLKAAKQIGLTIPPNVLARADRVIR
ncbi:MAG TPA: ABC transporter substrate-binding protein [Candidatus Binatia bacterium]|nr:ABC transporter substrate-binding protein [Candidatus Binatia bacterium]